MKSIRTHAWIQIFHISCSQLFLIKAFIINTVVYRKARPNSSSNINDWCNPNSLSFLSLSCLDVCYFSLHKSCACALSWPRQRHLTAGRAPGKFPEGLRQVECNCFNLSASKNLHTENSGSCLESSTLWYTNLSELCIYLILIATEENWWTGKISQKSAACISTASNSFQVVKEPPSHRCFL